MFVLYQVYVWRTQCRVRQEAAIRWQTAVRFAAQARSLPTCCSTYRTITPMPQHPPIVFVLQDQWSLRTSTVQSKADTSEAAPVHCCNSLPITWSGCCHWHIKKWQKKQWLCPSVSCCVRNRQNTWLDSVNILLSISDLVQNVQKGYLWNYKSCKGEISPHCAHWCGLQLCQISHSCELSSCCKCIKILH